MKTIIRRLRRHEDVSVLSLEQILHGRRERAQFATEQTPTMANNARLAIGLERRAN
jgi:hypothetical protein